MKMAFSKYQEIVDRENVIELIKANPDDAVEIVMQLLEHIKKYDSDIEAFETFLAWEHPRLASEFERFKMEINEA